MVIMSNEISAWYHKIAIHVNVQNNSYLNTLFRGPLSVMTAANKHLHFTKYRSAFKKCIISIFLSCKTNRIQSSLLDMKNDEKVIG